MQVCGIDSYYDEYGMNAACIGCPVGKAISDEGTDVLEHDEEADCAPN